MVKPKLTWDKLRLKVLERDNYTCIKCGGQFPENLRNKLHVHHKRPWRESHCDHLYNLQTLCVYCHTKHTAITQHK